jgi:hypothetical protein
LLAEELTLASAFVGALCRGLTYLPAAALPPTTAPTALVFGVVASAGADTALAIDACSPAASPTLPSEPRQSASASRRILRLG